MRDKSISRRLIITLILLSYAVFAGKDISFAAVPNPPTLSSPANGSNAAGTVVQFRWSQVTDATNYY